MNKLLGKIASVFLGDDDHTIDQEIKSEFAKPVSGLEDNLSGREKDRLVDSISYQHQLRVKIIDYLYSLYAGSGDCGNLRILIGFTDMNRYLSISRSTFKVDLLNQLSDKGFSFEDIDMKIKDEEDYFEISEGIGIKIISCAVCQQIKVAKVFIHNSSGSMLQEEYILQPQNNAVYNIGRGKGRGMRNNFICIDNENDDSEYWDNNHYVRTSHAHITYKSSIGYILYADEDGTSIRGSRTRVFSSFNDSNPFDLISPNIPYKLHDGNIIELGKKVCIIISFQE